MSYHQGPPYPPSGYYSPTTPQFPDTRAGPPYLTHTSQSYSHQSPTSAAYPSSSSSAYPRLPHVEGNRVYHRSPILPFHLRHGPSADTTRPHLNIGNNATHATVFGQNIRLYDEDTTFRLSESDFIAAQKPGWVKEGEDLVFGDDSDRIRRGPTTQRHFEGIQRLTIVGGTFTVGVRRVDYVGPEADRARPGERYGRAQREIDEVAKEVERRLDASRARRAQRAQHLPEAPPRPGLQLPSHDRARDSPAGFHWGSRR